MTFDNRLKCSKDLGMLGYQNGSGNIIGLPGQTISDIADDILFFAREQFDMIGIGPFIPHPATALSDCPPGDVEMVLKTIAVTRIITKDAHLPGDNRHRQLERQRLSPGRADGRGKCFNAQFHAAALEAII